MIGTKQIIRGGMMLLASTILMVTTGCDDNGSTPTPPAPKGPFTVSIYSTPTPKTKCSYFSFETNKVVELADADAQESKLWDIAIVGLSCRTNGGASGKGMGAAYRTNTTDFDNLKSAEEFIKNTNLWYTDKLGEIYYTFGIMPPPTTTMGINPLMTLGSWIKMDGSVMPPSLIVDDHVYIVRTAAGKYVKLQILDAKEGGKFGHFSLKYDFISDKGTNDKLAPREGEKVITGKEALSVLLPKEEAKSVRYLTIKDKEISQVDLDYIKSDMPVLEELDLTTSTLSIDPFDVGFKDNKVIKRLILPANLVTIGKGQLSYTGLEEVVFPGEKLENIGEGAFTFSGKIKSLKLPSSVIVIEKQAFYNMSSLEEINIPKNVVTLPYCTFMADKKLRRVVFEGPVKSFGSWVFDSCKSLTDLTFTSPAPPIMEKSWPFVDYKDWSNEDGSPRHIFSVPKGSVDAYLKAFKLSEEDRKFFREF